MFNILTLPNKNKNAILTISIILNNQLIGFYHILQKTMQTVRLFYSVITFTGWLMFYPTPAYTPPPPPSTLHGVANPGARGVFMRNSLLLQVDVSSWKQHSKMNILTKVLLLYMLSIINSDSLGFCPPFCDCTNWDIRTISCFKIEVLPSFHPSTTHL